MKKMTIAALAALSLFAIPAFAVASDCCKDKAKSEHKCCCTKCECKDCKCTAKDGKCCGATCPCKAK